jgi:hypothetical protein
MLQLSGDSHSNPRSFNETVRGHPMRYTQAKPPICSTVLVLLVIINGARADEPKEVRGRVVDEAGMPVAGASAGCFWRANGSGRDRDGNMHKDVSLVWGHLGEMESADGPQPIRTGADGRFAIKDPGPYFAVMAMDPSRRRAESPWSPRGSEPSLSKSGSSLSSRCAGHSRGHDPVSSRAGPMSTFSCPRIPGIRFRSTLTGLLAAAPSRRSLKSGYPLASTRSEPTASSLKSRSSKGSLSRIKSLCWGPKGPTSTLAVYASRLTDLTPTS